MASTTRDKRNPADPDAALDQDGPQAASDAQASAQGKEGAPTGTAASRTQAERDKEAKDAKEHPPIYPGDPRYVFDVRYPGVPIYFGDPRYPDVRPGSADESVVPGGFYIGVDGVPHDAHGRRVLTHAPHPTTGEPVPLDASEVAELEADEEERQLKARTAELAARREANRQAALRANRPAAQ